MGTIKSFEDLDVRQMARKYCYNIFVTTNCELFSRDLRFRGQIRASSGSIMDNIAEGFERGGNKEFIQFLSIAKGSCGESRSQLCRALDYGYISKEEFASLKEESVQLSKSIGGFIKYLKQTDMKGHKYS